MPTSPSRLAYVDCFNIYDQALEANKGIRIRFPEFGDAMNFRLRLHAARAIDRKDNKEIYADDHKYHGRSIYDVIKATVKNIKGKFYVYLEKLDGNNLEVEPIEDEEAIVGLAMAEPLVAPPTPKVERRF